MITSETNRLSRRQALIGLGATTALAGLSGCATRMTMPGSPGGGTAASADALLDDIAWDLLELSPTGATGLGLDTGEHAGMRSQLGLPMPEAREQMIAMLKENLARTRAFPKDGITPDQQTAFDVVESSFSTSLEGFALPYGDVAVGGWRNAPYVVIQNVGGYLDWPRFMGSTHPIREASDVEAYASRLEMIPAHLDGELERVREARAFGVIPPDFLLANTISQLESTIKTAREGSLFIDDLTPQLQKANITRDWAAELTPVVTGPIVAALERQLAELKSQLPQADSDAGMWSQPRGDEWYAWGLRAATTTSLSPDEIHTQGLEELEMLHGKMDPILREIGYTKGTVGERMHGLSKDERYQFAPGDPGRKQIMDFIHERIDWITAQMPRAFNTLVEPNLEVKRLPLAEEPGAPGAYGGAGSKDGSIPGRMWINLRTTDLHRKYDLADLVYHETIPGHVWEGEYSNRLPLIRSILAFSAFSEGWALYGEQLADELGAYDDFKVGRLGYLQSLAFRACRLVVDTGMHSKRWTRQQGRDFFVQRNGSKPEEVASEVDRYCSWPGQACGYKIGHTEINRQRERARSELGARYDLKAFDDAVVLGGNSPLDVMAKNVGRYIAANRA